MNTSTRTQTIPDNETRTPNKFRPPKKIPNTQKIPDTETRTPKKFRPPKKIPATLKIPDTQKIPDTVYHPNPHTPNPRTPAPRTPWRTLKYNPIFSI